MDLLKTQDGFLVAKLMHLLDVIGQVVGKLQMTMRFVRTFIDVQP